MEIKNLNEGVKKEQDTFIIDMIKDSDSDIINTSNTNINISRFKDNIYYFGYSFTNDASKKDRSDFITWLKSKRVEDITPSLESFIIRPLKILTKELQIEDFNLLLSPRSNRSDLVKIMLRTLFSILPHNVNVKSIELIKNFPKNVNFDWERFNEEHYDIIGTEQYKQIYNYIEDELMPKIHSLDYFSIAKNVKPKYRTYIKDYLIFNSNEEKELVESIKKGNILIVDDINTTGATLDEIIKIIKVINKDCNVYIFTLIGK